MSRPSPLLSQALQYFKRGAYPQAISLLQQAVAAQPALLEPRLQLAKACMDWVGILADMPLSDIEPETLSGEASHYLQLAAGQLQILEKTHPASQHVLGLLGVLHLVYSRYEEALGCLKKALAKDPRNPELLYNVGYALMSLDREDKEAVKLFERLTALYPGHGRGWQMLAQTRRYIGDLEASLPAYRKAISLLPDWHQPYGGLYSALLELGRPEEATEVLRTGLSSNTSIRDLNFHLANLALSTCDWATGWRYYKCRTNQKLAEPFPENYVIPLEKGRQVRIHYDQGMGDELFFLRFAPVLQAQGFEIEYTTTPKLFPLLEGMPCFAGLKVDESNVEREFDLLVGELPYATGMRSSADIPPPFPLHTDPEKVEALHRQLQDFGPPPYLGVTWWSGNRPPEKKKKGEFLEFLFKKVPIAAMADLAQNWPGTVVVLQRAPREGELLEFSKALGRPWLDWCHINDDLQEALAGLSLLDEYAGVSNTNMHLLAGLGKVARVLVPFPPEWRWMAEGKESPWFPGFKIYRPNSKRNWNAAILELADDLKAKWGSRIAESSRG